MSDSALSHTNLSFQPDVKSIITNSYEEDKTFRDICIIRVLNKVKFPVYLIHSKSHKQDYAMKVFPFAADKLNPHFQNEARFSSNDHPNIIKIHNVENERDTISQGHVKKVSYVVMEYAPYGDFFDLLMKHNHQIDEKLIRTYFRQLIQGLEYLHNNDVSHMDLKLENLLIGENYNLKIADFDLSHRHGDAKIISKGTKYYRAPEVIQRKCLNTKTSDIYSAGVILFALKSRGMLPHAEDSYVAGIDFAELLYMKNEQFWKKHCEVQKRDANFFDEDFKELFNSMIALNPRSRATIEDIKKSRWFNGSYYSEDELKVFASGLFEIQL